MSSMIEKKALKRGEKRGEKIMAETIAKKMLKEKYSIKEIVKLTGLSEIEVTKLR